MRVTSDYNLGKLYPNIVKEWHPTKNGELTPDQVTPGSGKKVWWMCTLKHEWETTVGNRTNGQGCPYCSGHRVGEDNNLAVKYSNLTQQWHPTKNGQLTPYHVTPGSGKKVWWKCDKGHEWNAIVISRSKGHGCPFCFNQKRGELIRKAAVKRSGSLAIKYPNIAEEWHPTKNEELTPYDVTPGSHMKIWWICTQGHELKTRVAHRTGGMVVENAILNIDVLSK